MSTLTLNTFLREENVRELQDYAAEILSGIEKSDGVEVANIDERNDVKTAFIEVYQIMKKGIRENSVSACSNDSMDQDFKLSSTDVNTIIKIIDQLNDRKWLESTDKSIQNLSRGILIYLAIAYMLQSGNLLINSSLNITNDIGYYDRILSKDYLILLYFIQTLPTNISKFVTSLQSYLINPKELEVTIPNWVPTISQNLYQTCMAYMKQMYSLIKISIQSFIHSPTLFLMEKGSDSRSLFNTFWNSTFKLPYYYAKHEVETKRINLIQLRRQNVMSLGILLSKPTLIDINKETNEMKSPIIDSIDGNVGFSLQDLNILFKEDLEHSENQMKIKYFANAKPSYLTRNWPLIVPTSLFLVSYLPTTIRNINLLITDSKTRDELYQYLYRVFKYGVETTTAFWRNWIVSPINNIIKTIRHDKNSEIALMSQQSLDSDLESLERMVVDYVVDSCNGSINIDDVRNAIKSGDMTLVMNDYEKDLKNPIKSIILGDMIRNILIQIQKTKVDGSLALNGVDQILKSQELVFGFVAASPSLFIIWSLKNSLISWYNGESSNSYKNLRKRDVKVRSCKSLGSIEKLVNRMYHIKEGDKKDYYSEGLLFIEVRNLKQLAMKILPVTLLEDFIQDIEELIDTTFSNTYKQLVVQRIWNVYGGYFR